MNLKVDGNNSPQAVNLLKQSFADSDSIVLMQLLRKCAEEIKIETLNAKIETLHKDGSDHKISSTETLKKSSRGKNYEQAFLEAFLTALQMDHELNVISQDSIRMLLMKANQDAKHLDAITKEIKALKEKLSASMSIKELQDLSSQLEQIVNAYNSLIKKKKGDEKSFEKNLNQIVSDLSALSIQYPAFAEKINEIQNAVKEEKSVAGLVNDLISNLKSEEKKIESLIDQIENKKEQENVLNAGLKERIEVVKGIVKEASKSQLSNLEKKEVFELLDQIMDRYLQEVERGNQKKHEKAIAQERVLEALLLKNTGKC